MPFDKTLPIDVNLTVRAELNDTSLSQLADLLQKVHQTMLGNGCVFVAYDIFSECEDTLVMINHVTPSDIESGELEQRLQAALNYIDEEVEKGIPSEGQKSDLDRRLTVFIKSGQTK